MGQLNATHPAGRYSLTDLDLAGIRGALPKLGGRWLLLTESGDEGELYGRILSPWGNPGNSAFLLEREDDALILTDNLAEPDRCAVTLFQTAAAAMQTVENIVRTAAMPPRPA
jgi:hypothetical protein